MSCSLRFGAGFFQMRCEVKDMKRNIDMLRAEPVLRDRCTE